MVQPLIPPKNYLLIWSFIAIVFFVFFSYILSESPYYLSARVKSSHTCGEWFKVDFVSSKHSNWSQTIYCKSTNYNQEGNYDLKEITLSAKELEK